MRCRGFILLRSAACLAAVLWPAAPLAAQTTIDVTFGGTISTDYNTDPNGIIFINHQINDVTTLSGTITGSSGMTKNGAGVVKLSGSTDNVGLTATANGGWLVLDKDSSSSVHAIGGGDTSITINGGGTLQLAGTGGDQIFDWASVLVNDGGRFDLNGRAETINNLTGTGVVTSLSGAATLTVGGHDGSSTFDGVLQDGVSNAYLSLTKIGTGTLTLTAASTYSQATTVKAGGLALLGSGRLPDSTALTVDSGATFYLNGITDSIGSLAGGGTVQLVNGTLTLGTGNASTTFSGTVNSGTLSKLNSGILTLSGTADNFNLTAAVSGGTLVLGKTSSGTVHAVGPGLTISGNGIAQLGGTGGDQIYTAANVALGGTLDMNGRNEGFNNLTGTGRVTNNALYSTSTLTLGENNGSATFSGSLQNDASGTGVLALTKVGSGTLTLTAINNSYTGPTTISGGTLALTASGALGVGTTFVSNGATLDLGGTSQTVAGLGQPGAGVVGSITAGTIQTTGSVVLQSGTFANTFTGSGTDARLWIGGDPNATVTLNGTNDRFTVDHSQVIIGHSTTGAAGTVKVGNANALARATEDVLVFTGTLDLNGVSGVRAGRIYLDSSSNASLVNSNTSSAASFAGGVTLGNASAVGGDGDLALSGALAGGSFTKTGAGKLTLSGSNSYTGGATLSAGTLTLGSSSALGSSGTISFAGGTLQFSAGNNNDYSSRFSTAAGQALSLDTNGRNVTLATALTSSGGTLAKLGSGTLTLTRSNTYTGATTLSGGTLALSGSGTLGAGPIFVRNGATLDLGGTTQSVSSIGLFADGVVGSITAGTIQTTGNVALRNGTFANTFTGTGVDARIWIGGDPGATVTLNGTNDMVFTSDHNQVIIGFSDITGYAGTVKIGNANALAAATENVYVAGGTLDLNGVAGVRANSIHLNAGSDTSLVNGSTASGASYSGPVSLVQAGTVVGGAGSLALGGVLGGAGGINKTGAGTLALAAGNTYTGATTISAGTLKVNGSLSASSSVTINSGGTLGGSGTVAGTVAINSGGRISPGNSPGTLNTGVETWKSGGGYVWELNNASSAAGAKGVTYDWLNIFGALNVTATSGSRFTIYVTSLDAGNAAGTTPGFVFGQSYQWILATASSGITSFNADKFAIDTSAFLGDFRDPNGFTISQVGNSLLLNYTAIPEPAKWGAIAGMALLGIGLLRRNFSKHRRGMDAATTGAD